MLSKLSSRSARVYLLLALQTSILLSARSVFALSAEELKARLDKGERLTLIDVRENVAFRRGHLPGAINVPASVADSKRLPPLGEVVVYGDGVDVARTRRALVALASKPGIRTRMLEGGYERWAALGFPGGGKRGLGRRDFQFVTYDHLQESARSNPALVLVDLRGPVSGSPIDGGPDIDIGPDTGSISVGVVTTDRGEAPARVIFAEHDEATASLAERFPGAQQRWFELPEVIRKHLEQAARSEASLEIVQLGEAARDPFVSGDTSDSRIQRTDLSVEFPGLRVMRSSTPTLRAVAGSSPGSAAELRASLRTASLIPQMDRQHRDVHVLIDDGDGSALDTARRLHAAGVRRIRILQGGEMALRHRGQPVRKTISSK